MIPTDWSQISLEKFYPFSQTMNEKPQTELQVLDLRIKRACYLTGLEPEEVELMPMDKLLQVDELIKKPLPTKLSKYIRLKGTLYRIELDPTKLDAWRYKAIMNECRSKKGDNLHRVLYLFCIPINNRMSKSEIKIPANKVSELMEDFKQLPISVVNPLIVFFCNLLNDLTKVIELYSVEQMKKTTKKMRQEIDYLKSMDGL